MNCVVKDLFTCIFNEMHGKSQKCQTKNGSRDYKIEGKLQLGNN